MSPDPIDYDDLDRRFMGRVLSDEAVELMNAIASSSHDLAVTILQSTPKGREQSLALTKVEEAMLWACEAIGRESDAR